MPRRIAVGSLSAAFCGFVLIVSLGVHASVAQERPRTEAKYRSPYRVEFHWPVSELIGDLESTERGNPRMESEVPFQEWYSHRTLERWGAWGPPPRVYPRPEGISEWSVERRRERVLAVALRYVGYGYQHHHIPDWTPPAHWPWKSTCVGSNGPGVDCSNFTGFVYNQGFGVHLNTEVEHQSEGRPAHAGWRAPPVKRVDLAEGYHERLETLQTGDLVYIRSRRGNISHVVIWVGAIGKSPDETPLILDSHGDDVRDCEGQSIPCGIHLRPFHEDSWYNRSASHALRVHQ